MLKQHAMNITPCSLQQITVQVKISFATWQIDELNQQCWAVCYISWTRDNSSWSSAGNNTLASAGKLKDANVQTEQTSSLQMDSNQLLHKGAQQKTLSFPSIFPNPWHSLTLWGRQHSRRSGSYGFLLTDFFHLLIYLLFNTLSASNHKVARWDIEERSTDCFPPNKLPLPILHRPEFVLALLPAWAVVPGNQVHQQTNKSFPSCQGPKQGGRGERGSEQNTCFLISPVCCFRKKRRKIADCNVTHRWKTECWHTTQRVPCIQVLKQHWHMSWLLMLILQEIFSVNQSLMNVSFSIKMLSFHNLRINFLYTVFMLITKPMNEAKDQQPNRMTGRTNQANAEYCPITNSEKTRQIQASEVQKVQQKQQWKGRELHIAQRWVLLSWF